VTFVGNNHLKIGNTALHKPGFHNA